jgi:hypothetical protein
MKREVAKLVKQSYRGFTIDFPATGKPPFEVTINYSFDDVHDLTGELWDAVLPKFRGRPALPTKFDILDAAAQAKAMGRPYSHVGRKYGKSDKHVRDLVRNNKPYVLKKQAELSATNKSK